VSQATQERKDEAEQAANNLKEMIKQLEESMAEKKEHQKWEEVGEFLQRLQDQNQKLWNNCADAEKKIQELQQENNTLISKVKKLERKVMDMKAKDAPSFDLHLEGK
jgi:chromosome segregation ATPase